MSAHRKRSENDASSSRGGPRQSGQIRNQRAMPPQRYLTIQGVADQLDVSARTVRRWIESGDLVAHDFGRLVRVGENDLGAFVATRRRF